MSRKKRRGVSFNRVCICCVYESRFICTPCLSRLCVLEIQTACPFSPSRLSTTSIVAAFCAVSFYAQPPPYFLTTQIIEKRRRDRINTSLVELRRLVPAAFEKQASFFYKTQLVYVIFFILQTVWVFFAKGQPIWYTKYLQTVSPQRLFLCKLFPLRLGWSTSRNKGVLIDALSYHGNQLTPLVTINVISTSSKAQFLSVLTVTSSVRGIHVLCVCASACVFSKSI